ncbi:MAG: carbon-nitrogen hydrolase family protein [Bacteroidota bacterium]
MNETINVTLAQLSPVLLNKKATLEKMLDAVSTAASDKSDLIVFGEALLPGYPFWTDALHGATFNSKMHKEIHAKYMKEAICLENDELLPLQETAKSEKIAMYVGIIERPLQRGGHSLYCSMVYIDKSGIIQSVHRKLRPTYEERLSWSPGDGNGLAVHPLGAFTIGGLNCWENWMPLARAAMYAQGESLHVSIWPGSKRNTEDIIPFIAKEARSYSLGVSGLFRPSDIPDDFPFADELKQAITSTIADGGSCLANPDGSWLIEPMKSEERIATVEINHARVREERQNFDPSGHYSRPDVFKLSVNRERQSIIALGGSE